MFREQAKRSAAAAADALRREEERMVGLYKFNPVGPIA
jgi:hypothetical protein